MVSARTIYTLLFIPSTLCAMYPSIWTPTIQPQMTSDEYFRRFNETLAEYFPTNPRKSYNKDTFVKTLNYVLQLLKATASHKEHELLRTSYPHQNSLKNIYQKFDLFVHVLKDNLASHLTAYLSKRKIHVIIYKIKPTLSIQWDVIKQQVYLLTLLHLSESMDTHTLQQGTLKLFKYVQDQGQQVADVLQYGHIEHTTINNDLNIHLAQYKEIIIERLKNIHADMNLIQFVRDWDAMIFIGTQTQN